MGRHYWTSEDTQNLVQALSSEGLARERLWCKVIPKLKKMVAAIYYGNNYRNRLEMFENASVNKNELLSHVVCKLQEYGVDANNDVFAYLSKIIINYMVNITKLTESLKIENKDLYRKRGKIVFIDDYQKDEDYYNLTNLNDHREPLFEVENKIKPLTKVFVNKLNKLIKWVDSTPNMSQSSIDLKINEKIYLTGVIEYLMGNEEYTYYGLYDINAYVLLHSPLTLVEIKKFSKKHFKAYQGSQKLIKLWENKQKLTNNTNL